MDNGKSFRENLQEMRDKAEKRQNLARLAELEEQLALPAIPMGGAYLINTYWRIRRRKGSAGMGPSPIEWPDISAFVQNTQFTLAPWEVEIIEDIDDVYMAEQARQMREKM